MINSETRITATIDWISVTAEIITHPLWTIATHKPLERGMLNYDSGVRYEDGRIELWHSTREGLKNHLIMSGETLLKMSAQYGKSVFQILSAYGYARPSRIDVAVDVIGGTLDIGMMGEQMTDGEVTTRATGGLYLSGIGSDSGETLYIGSTKGNRRMRVYDKASESGLEGEWTRIELQTRGRQAQKSLDVLMTRLGDTSALPELILSFADWSNYADWRVTMGNVQAELPRYEKPPTNRRNWILDTVARAIAAEIEDTGEESLIGTLLDAVGVHRDIIHGQVVDKPPTKG